jgi:dihydroorotate dehydrogenase (NAD+) catalytic subunit
MINSVGLANPGAEVVAREMLPWLASNLSGTRVIVNVVGDVVEDYANVVRRLQDQTVVTAFELNVSCPNTERGGEEFGADSDVLSDLVLRCVAETDKPVLVKLAPTLPDVAATARAAAASGAQGVSVINTMPGLVLEGGKGTDSPRPRLGGGRGGVSGPGLLPIGILATRRVTEATGLPVIGMGGVRTKDDVEQYLMAGASLVAVGTAFLADPRCPERIAGKLEV